MASVILFSARIIRPMGIIFPVVIPLFLYFFHRLGNKDASDRPGIMERA
jgi:uncharacterized membrane protein (DUF106 family)